MAPPHFCQLIARQVGRLCYVKNKEAMCLSEKQANYIYKKVEKGKIINTNTMKHEIEHEIDREDDNPYKRVILNKVYKEEDKIQQMENWSIFSDNVRYVQHDEKNPHKLDLHTLDYRQHKELYCKLKGEESETLDVDFGINPETLKSNYFDMYEGIHAEMIYTNRFDENANLSTTYLGQTKMIKDMRIKAEEKFPITRQGFTSGKLLDGSECQILLDTGAMKSYISKSYYLRCKCLQALPKIASNTQRIQVGNGLYVGVLLVIPVIIDAHGHRFEICTLVSEIHENVDWFWESKTYLS